MRSSICIPGLLVLAVAMAGAQPVPEKKDLAQAVQDLGDPSFQVRKRAQEALAKAGWEAKAELEKATKNADPEVSDVARQLLAEMLPGVTSETPERLRKLVDEYTRRGNWNERRQYLRELLNETPPSPQILFALLEWEKSNGTQAAFLQDVLGQCSRVCGGLAEADRAWFQRQFLQWIVRLEVERGIFWVVTYTFHQGRVQEMQEQVARQVATAPTPFLRRLLVELDLMAGKEKEALRQAKEMGDDKNYNLLLIRTCRWEELAQRLIQSMGRPNGAEMVSLAAAQRLAGQDRLAAQTLASMATLSIKAKKSGTGDQEDADGIDWGGGGDAGGDVDLFWPDQQLEGLQDLEALFGNAQFDFDAGWEQQPVVLNGRMGRVAMGSHGGYGKQSAASWQYLLAYGLTSDVVNGLVKSKKEEQAVQILLQQYRYPEADRLFRQTIEKAKSPGKWGLRIRRAALLRDLGDDSAVATVDELFERCRKGEGVLADPQVYIGMLGFVGRAGFRKELAKAMPELIARMPTGAEPQLNSLICFLVPAKCAGVVDDWWGKLRSANPDEAPEVRAERLRKLLSGELDGAATDAMLRSILDPNERGSERASRLRLVAKTCGLLGRDKEAVAAYRLAIRFAEESKKGNAGWNGRTELAVFLAGRQRWEEAADVYGEMWGKYARLTHLVNQAIALRFAGKTKASQEHMDLALSLSSATDARWMLNYLDEAGWDEPARRLLPLLVWQPSMLPDEALAVARREGKGGLERQLAERIWYGNVLSPSNTGRERLLTVNATLAFAECRGKIVAGKADEALAEAKRVSDSFPFDIDGAADTVEAFDRAGKRALGDELTAYVLAREEGMLDKLPNAVQHLNGYAWLCARTGRELAKGEEHIRRALERVPERDAYLDTLSVLQYRRGNLDAAIATARRCLEIDPNDMHHRYQLARWLAEKREKP
jgi:tetratricopeptide (TPR) repeat protein